MLERDRLIQTYMEHGDTLDAAQAKAELQLARAARQAHPDQLIPPQPKETDADQESPAPEPTPEPDEKTLPEGRIDELSILGDSVSRHTQYIVELRDGLAEALARLEVCETHCSESIAAYRELATRTCWLERELGVVPPEVDPPGGISAPVADAPDGELHPAENVSRGSGSAGDPDPPAASEDAS